MKLTNALLVLALTSGTVWAQNGPVIIHGAKANADAAQQKQHAAVKVVSAAMPQASKPAAASKTPVAKPSASSASSKSPMSPRKAVAVKPVAVKPVAVKPVAATKPATSKPVVVKSAPVAATAKQVSAPAKAVKVKVAVSKPSATMAPKQENVSVEKAPEPAKNEKTTRTISANGRRDPFVSPVISQSAVGSGCSSGKRCLAVGQISLKGVVKSETGMIAVVVNALDKAYFLRENDPVFDGYVLKITGDSIVFKETVQDKLGKPFTKEVTKKINTPVV